MDPQPAPSSISTPLISAAARLIDWSAIVVPFVAFIVAAFFCWGHGLNWSQVGILLAMYLLTGFGITVGFHRYFTHKSFEAPAPVEVALALLGSMSVQGPLLWWVAMHRRHHQCSDAHGDPHSPHHHGNRLISVLRGAWHSHVGWLFKADEPGCERYVVDLQKNTSLRVISQTYPIWVLLSLALPAAAGGLITGTLAGAMWGFVWGGLARVFFVHHITWSVNSICHLWGSRPYQTHDQSRNNALLGILALGEGWHNNHHAFPTSARHGLRWWQLDLTYGVIRLMEILKLASKLRVPSAHALATKAPAVAA